MLQINEINEPVSQIHSERIKMKLHHYIKTIVHRSQGVYLT